MSAPDSRMARILSADILLDLYLGIHVVEAYGILLRDDRQADDIVEPVEDLEFVSFESGASYGQQILSAMDVHLLSERDRLLFAGLHVPEAVAFEHGVGTRVMYPPINRQEAYVNVYGEPDESKFPVSNLVGAKGLWLPSAGQLTDKEIETICRKIKNFYA